MKNKGHRQGGSCCCSRPTPGLVSIYTPFISARRLWPFHPPSSLLSLSLSRLLQPTSSLRSNLPPHDSNIVIVVVVIVVIIIIIINIAVVVVKALLRHRRPTKGPPRDRRSDPWAGRQLLGGQRLRLARHRPGRSG